ncbi:hypothetical protein CVT25_011461 [Psilocybe cyanescens]|uniref:Aminopeptidase n=1 Tax=Psilocybe cyanescens TaxID=93625 RepID=A0A409XAF2_PSICY|nr:hypothetical protein CVT25_011461 [Psilocybe cyanescens]
MSTTGTGVQDAYRLPTSVKPIHYDITVKTDLEKLTFEGLAKISLEIKTDTSTIVLNASKDLELRKATIYSDASEAGQAPTISLDTSQERAAFQLTDKLRAGSKAELRIDFAGKLAGSMSGYYRASWVNEGKTEYYALTQFEPTAARRAFPCWDEPLLKATYSITMISRTDTVNLSNMSVLLEEPIVENTSISPDIADIIASIRNENWKITKFTTSPPMSTYIVAIANGPFSFLETSVVMPVSGKTVPLRVYTTPDVVHQAEYALGVKAAVLPLYEKIFDVEYPLPKLDTLVASDFDAGAMENWGLIIGRMSGLLLDSKRTDIRAKKGVVSMQSHEVAHMWFGNITTMEWWNNLYLNEDRQVKLALVYFVPLISTVRVYPEWRVNSEFITAHLNQALRLDSKISSHPVEVDCPDANNINQIFDDLSYSKAASVLRMLSHYVGEEKFLKGVSIYLKKKLFANSVTHDLWDGISAATGLDITEFMENWITKIGFPVLSITEDAEGITVRQDRFLETGPPSAQDNEILWNIPLNILSIKNGIADIDRTPVLRGREEHIPLDTSKPFKLNAATNGVYRVLYTPERLALIAAEAAKADTIFSLEDRMGLVYDTMALSKAGFANIASSLTLVYQLKDETECEPLVRATVMRTFSIRDDVDLVWQAISLSLSEIRSIWWEYPEITDTLDVFLRSLFVPLVEKLGYEYPDGESVDTSLLRTLAIEQAFEAGAKNVIDELKGRFKTYQESGDDSNIPADLQRVVYLAIKAGRYGGREVYDLMAKIYEKPKTPSEQESAIRAMCSTQDESLIIETFKFIEHKARDQDVLTFFSDFTWNFKARRPLTKFWQDEYDVMFNRFEGNFVLNFILPVSRGKTLAKRNKGLTNGMDEKSTISFYSTKKDYFDIEAFYNDKDTSKFNQTLAQSLDNVRARAEYVERSTVDLKNWLNEL